MAPQRRKTRRAASPRAIKLNADLAQLMLSLPQRRDVAIQNILRRQDYLDARRYQDMKAERDRLRSEALSIPDAYQKSAMLRYSDELENHIQHLLDAPRRPFAVFADAVTSR